MTRSRSTSSARARTRASKNSNEDRQKKGLPWPVAYADEGMLASLNIRSQASKIAIGSDGTILHRAGAGTAGFDSWTALFDDIAAN